MMNGEVHSVEVQIARHDERILDLEKWREKTNGHLERIEGKLNSVGWGIAFTLGGVVLDLILRLVGR